jgi:hypothetical protein
VLWILCAISSAGKFSCILCMTHSCCSKCSYARLCSSVQLHWKCLWPQCQGSLAEVEADGPNKFGNSKLFFYLLCLHDFSPCKLGWVGQLGLSRLSIFRKQNRAAYLMKWVEATFLLPPPFLYTLFMKLYYACT